MTDNFTPPKVKKIAILNPYLQRGLTQSSEVEGTLRFIAAAKNMGIHAAAVSCSEDIYAFDPDFVISLSHQEPKLTPYPTYGSLGMPVSWVTHSPRFLRNIFSYDAFLAPSQVVQNWLKAVCAKINKVLYVSDAAFSVPKTEFKTLDLQNATLAYMGVNWDGLRHHALFSHFVSSGELKCYGPKESWAKFPAEIYGGMIPFDGFSTLETYANHGIGLCINHPDFDQDGVPNCRTFEIPASSAVTICANNPYMKKYFGDSVLYVDKNLPTKDLADAIKEKIHWVRENPQEAQALAKKAHDIFNHELASEIFIEKILQLHHEVMRDYGFNRSTHDVTVTSSAPKITYLVPVDNVDTIDQLIKNIQQQTYDNVNIILLCSNLDIQAKLSHYASDKINILSYNGINSNPSVLQTLNQHNTTWLGILKNDDKLFTNHSSLLMKTYQQSNHQRENESFVVVFANSLEHSDTKNLKDKIQDDCMLYLSNNVRVGNITPCAEIPLCSVLFKLTEPAINVFQQIDFASDLKIEFSSSSMPLDIAIHANAITSSAFVGLSKSQNQSQAIKSSVLLIRDATSLLDICNHPSLVEGKLMNSNYGLS